MSIILSKKQLAQAYGISPSTLRKWLKELGIENRNKILHLSERIMVIEKYGNPFVNVK